MPSGVPHGQSVTVLLGSRADAAGVIDLGDQRQTVGNISYAADAQTTISGSELASLMLDNGPLGAKISLAGAHVIDVPLELLGDATIVGDGTLAVPKGISGPYALRLLGGQLTTGSAELQTLEVGQGAKLVFMASAVGASPQPPPEPAPEPHTSTLLCAAAVMMLLAGKGVFRARASSR
jgi:hypothetical protein